MITNFFYNVDTKMWTVTVGQDVVGQFTTRAQAEEYIQLFNNVISGGN